MLCCDINQAPKNYEPKNVMDSKEGPEKGGIIQISNFNKPRNIFYSVFSVYTEFIMSKLLLKNFMKNFAKISYKTGVEYFV